MAEDDMQCSLEIRNYTSHVCYCGIRDKEELKVRK